MRFFITWIALSFIALGCGERSSDEAQGVAEMYCARLGEAQVARPLESAIALAGRAQSDDANRLVHCAAMSESLAATVAYHEGFDIARELASRSSGRVFVAVLDRSLIESSRTEAEVACRIGDFAELDRVLHAMESQAREGHEHAARQCADPAGE